MDVETQSLRRSEVTPLEVLILRFFSGPVLLEIAVRDVSGLFVKFKFLSFGPAHTNGSVGMSIFRDQDFILSLLYSGLSFLGIF